jgi:membrane-associated phospholipid phosphatase
MLYYARPVLRRPLDILNCFVVVALLLVAVVCRTSGRLDAAPILVMRLAAMLGFVVIVSAIARSRPKFLPRRGWLGTAVGLVVDFYPIALIPLVYDSLGFLIPALNPVEKDPWLIAIDRATFGLDPTLWLQRFIWPPLTDVLYLAYATFFFFPLFVGIPLWRRSPAMGRRFLFLISLAFYISYAGYMLVPAEGPRAGLSGVHLVSLQQTPISRLVAGSLDGLERNRVDAFPSGHVLVTTLCLITAARQFKRLFLALLPLALLLMVATLYCRYHYVIDVIAGLALVPFVQIAANRLYDRLGGAERPAILSSDFSGRGLREIA